MIPHRYSPLLGPLSAIPWSPVFLLIAALLALSACEDGGSGAHDPDAGKADSGGELDGGSDAPDAGRDRDRDTGQGDAQADEAGHPPACTCPPEHPCRPNGRCDCRKPDHDGDGFKARACGGDDCNDADETVKPNAAEVCDAEGVDEDCDPETFVERDEDGDGYHDAACFNLDPDTGERQGGDDCNDGLADIHPGASEICDYRDNNCNDLVDEDPDGVEHGAREVFYPDVDADGYGDHDAEPVLACLFPANHVPGNGPADPDDHNFNVYPGAPEVCDGDDNDGENGTDGDDPNFVKHIEFTNTSVECVEGRLEITECPPETLWCPERVSCSNGEEWCDAKLERGCDVDGTRLSSCGECETSCLFSCGRMNDGTNACDEIVQISAGNEHTCAVTEQGRAACWGRGALGRLGNDSIKTALVPELVVGLEDVKKIAAGPAHTCAIAGEDRTLYCWGSNSSGQLGVGAEVEVGDGEFIAVPVAVGVGTTSFFSGDVTSPVLRNVAEVELGEEHTCAVLEMGLLTCWGRQSDGRLGNGLTESVQPIPSTVTRENTFTVLDADLVAVGSQHACAVTNGQDVVCWGDNTYGQLGREGSVAASSRALPVPDLEGVTAIAAGSHHTCVIAGERERVLCWGRNSSSQLGRDTGSEEQFDSVPQLVEPIENASRLASGRLHVCATTEAQSLWCWGSNEDGQAGSSPVGSVSPQVVAALGVVDSIAAGTAHTCVRKENGQSTCWGWNAFGQLGNGVSSQSSGPTPHVVRSLLGSTP